MHAATSFFGLLTSVLIANAVISSAGHGKQLEPGGAKDTRQSDPSMQQFLAMNARKEAVAREVVAVARESGHPPAQVALAWLRQRETPIIPIIGARKLS